MNKDTNEHNWLPSSQYTSNCWHTWEEVRMLFYTPSIIETLRWPAFKYEQDLGSSNVIISPWQNLTELWKWPAAENFCQNDPNITWWDLNGGQWSLGCMRGRGGRAEVKMSSFWQRLTVTLSDIWNIERHHIPMIMILAGAGPSIMIIAIFSF